jgi:hypothetical protein
VAEYIFREYNLIISSDWKPDAITAAATAVLAILTLSLAAGTFGLWFATRRLVRSAEKTAERQLRAYVLVDEGSIVLSQIGFWDIQISFHNFGQTPAYQHSTWIGGEVLPFSHTGFPQPTQVAQRKGESIVGPTARFHIKTDPIKLVGEEYAEIVSGTKAFFVWGGCDYTDAFEVRRFFIFRMRMHGLPSASPQGARSWALKPHPIGNEAN